MIASGIHFGGRYTFAAEAAVLELHVHYERKMDAAPRRTLDGKGPLGYTQNRVYRNECGLRG